MATLREALSHCDHADLVILIEVESLRESQQPTYASAIAGTIGGAPTREVAMRLAKMTHLGLLEVVHNEYVPQYAVTVMGAEMGEMHGWTPGRREEERRAANLSNAVNGTRFV